MDGGRVATGYSIEFHHIGLLMLELKVVGVCNNPRANPLLFVPEDALWKTISRRNLRLHLGFEVISAG